MAARAHWSTSPKTTLKFRHLLQDDGWIERKDVFVRYGSRKDPLSRALAFAHLQLVWNQFGTVVGDALEEPVLLIKTCWEVKAYIH